MTGAGSDVSVTAASSRVRVTGAALQAVTAILAAAGRGAVRLAADAGTLTLADPTGLHARIPGTGELAAAQVDARDLERACAALGAAPHVTVSATGDHLLLTPGAGAPVTVPLLPAPAHGVPIPQLTSRPVVTVTGDGLTELASVARLVAPAAEPVPAALRAVAVHATRTGVSAAATDRRHLALATVPATGSGRVLLPAGLLTAAAAALADRPRVELELAEEADGTRWSALDSGDARIAAREPDGYFPSIGSALGTGSVATAQVEAAALRAAVREAGGEHVWLQVRGGEFTVAALSLGPANRELPVAGTVSGGPAAVVVVASALLAGLRFLAGAVEVGLPGPRMPLLLSAGSRRFVLASHPG